MWKLTLYKNTGMNSVNTVDKPSRLAKADAVVLPVLDILQGEFLTSINVKATRQQVKDVDFLALQDESTNDTFFYSVESFTSTSVDVQTLFITMDALLTLEFLIGGIENITILDGITERHHVKTDDDVYGAFTEEDPLLVPSQELGFNEEYAYNDKDDTLHTIIQSTAQLRQTGASSKSVTYTDGTNKVTVPSPAVPVPVGKETLCEFGADWSAVYKMAGTQLWDYNTAGTKEGLDKLRGLGIEQGSIYASYSIPETSFQKTENADGHIDVMSGTKYEVTLNINITRGMAGIRNMRVFYGSINTIELISVASGMRMSFKPEDLAKVIEGTYQPLTLVRITDPRPSGRPYFQFKYFKGIDQTQAGFFANAVAGATWANAPIVYDQASGSQLNEIRYNTTMEGMTLAGQQQIDRMNYDLQRQQRGMLIGTINNAASIISGAATGNGVNIVSGVQNQLSSIYNYTENVSQAQFNKAQLDETYAYNSRKELMNLKINNTIVAPDLHFPNSETIRDFLGNGVYVVQYTPVPSDLFKLDKILTMYGYKNTKPLAAEDFTSRSRFNYVQAHGVTIGGNVPKWLREAAAAQISAGVRVWHKLPDVRDYTEGGNN